MMLVLVYFAATVLIEVLLPRFPLRFGLLRQAAGYVAIGLLIALAAYWLINSIHVLSLAMLLLSAYRSVNILRILNGRLPPGNIIRAAQTTSFWLIGAQALTWLSGIIWERLPDHAVTVWLSLAVAQFIAAVVLLSSVRRHFKHLKTPEKHRNFSANELPSVTIAVAARNETEDLIQCIESLLASDYPKLEILVLDDCSQTRQTPEIIRSFAHKGVRFIPGKEPDDGWLARNQAYDRLAQAANGTYIVFCSSGVRLQPDSIGKMVRHCMANHKTMLCVMPRMTASSKRLAFAQPIRAAWELLPPRRRLRRPPVFSSCWMIAAASLRKSGGFNAVRHMVTPEAYFARSQTFLDGYCFIPGGERFGVASRDDQVDAEQSLLRSAYPSLHRRLEMLAVAAAVIFITSILPFFMALLGLVKPDFAVISAFSAAAVILMLAAYGEVLVLCYGRTNLLQICLLPVAAVSAIFAYHKSMYKYEFSEVLWKNRNICLPVMQAVPRLPSE